MKRPRLVINADDLGLSPEVDAGILEAVQAGVVTAVELLVNPPFSAWLQPFFMTSVSIGLHLNLCLGRPCCDLLDEPGRPSNVPSLVQENGSFFSDLSRLFDHLDPSEAHHELEAQFARFCEVVGRPPAHLTFHKHLHARDRRLFDLIAEMGLKHRIPVRALDSAMRKALRDRGVRTCDAFLGDVKPSPYWTVPRLTVSLKNAHPGVTELMCHPGKMMRPIPGIWYLHERDIELAALLSPDTATACSRYDLVTFTEAFSE